MTNNTFKNIVIFLLTIIFNSCNVFTKNVKKSKSIQMEEVHIKSINPYNIYRIVFTNKLDILHTNLVVQFNWENHELLGKTSIICKPYAYPLDTITLDAKSMKINTVLVNNVATKFLYDNKYLDIILPKKINSNDTQKIEIDYIAMPDKKTNSGSKAISNDKGLYFINTNKKDKYKPTEIWTQGETESNSCWFPIIDKPNEKCTFSISIEVPDNLTTLSNGELVKSTTNNNMRTDYWEQTKPMSAYLVMMAIGKFAKETETWRGKNVDYYVEEKYKNDAKKIFAHTPEMIEYFSTKLGVAYPWNKYAQVIARDYVSGAMENTSATLHGEFVQKTNRELIDNANDGIIAHELFHQWFGDLVTAKSWSNLTLNEGFASFGELLWGENNIDKNVAENILYNHLNGYLQYAKILDGALVQYYYADKESMFNPITYKKGACVLHLLRNELGEEIFFKAIKNFLENNAYKSADIHDLQKAMEEASGRDLHPFFNQWFLRGGHPILDINYTYESKNKLKINTKQMQDSSLFSTNLLVQLVHNGKYINTNLPITKKDENFVIDFTALQITDSNVNPVIIVDANHTFIGEINETKPDEAFANVFYQNTSYIDRVRVLDYFNSTQASNTIGNKVYKNALKDANKYIRYACLQRINEEFLKNKIDVEPLLKNIIDNDEYSLNKQYALTYLKEYKNQNYKNTYQQLCMDSSYKVSGNALQCLFNIDSIEAYKTAKSLAPNAIAELRTNIANVIAKNGKAIDTTYFDTNIPQTFGYNRVSMLYNYMLLATSNKGEKIFYKVVETIKNIAKDDERTEIKTQAVEVLENTKEALTYKKFSIENNSNEFYITYLTQTLNEIFTTEKDENVLKAYRKKEWIK